MSSLSTSLKNSYQKWLCPYEEYLRVAKPGVHQQLENEYGGPFTPSPVPSPLKKSAGPTSAGARDSPAQHATESIQATMDSDRDTPMGDSCTPQPTTTTFRAINTFKTANSSEPSSFGGTPKFGSPLPSAKNTPDYRPSALGLSHALKRQQSTDSLDSRHNGSTDRDDDNGSRRSKRLKKGKKSNSHSFGTMQLLLSNELDVNPVSVWSFLVTATASKMYQEGK